jgi:hypothetical protein
VLEVGAGGGQNFPYCDRTRAVHSGDSPGDSSGSAST